MVAAVVGIAASVLAGPTSAIGTTTTCPADRSGINPSFATEAGRLQTAAATYSVPPAVLKTIAYGEGFDSQTGRRWAQFYQGSSPGTPGPVIISFDCGIGIMQITNAQQYDQELLKSDIGYNIDAGAQILSGKWDTVASLYTSDGIPVPDRNLVENWYEPVRYYNGSVACDSYPYEVAVRTAVASAQMPSVAPWAAGIPWTLPQSVRPVADPQPCQYPYFTVFAATGPITDGSDGERPGTMTAYSRTAPYAKVGSWATTVHDWTGVPTERTCELKTFGPECTNAGFLLGPSDNPQYWRSGAPDGRDHRMVWTYGNGIAAGDFSTADWTPAIPDGSYLLSAWVPATDATATVTYYVTSSTGITPVVVDQALHHGSYVSLGRFSRQGALSVHLGDGGVPSTERIAVDAIRFDGGAPTTLTLSAPARPLPYGYPVPLSITLVRSDTGAAVAGAPLTLTWSTHGSSTVKGSTALTTGADGTVRDWEAPVENTDYRVTYDGAVAYTGSTAGIFVPVAPVVTGRLTPTSMLLGRTAYFTITLSPNQAGQRVGLQRWTGRQWMGLISYTLGADSTTTFPIRPGLKGTYQFRSYRYASSTMVAAATATVTLTVD